MTTPKRPVLGTVAVVCRMMDARPHVILVERGKPPSAGTWGFPGGHVEWGETAMAGAARELLEETGITALPRDILRTLDVIQHNDQGAVTRHYLLTAVACDYVSGEVCAQDDADDARWFAVEDLAQTDLPLLPNVQAVALEAQARLLRRIATESAPTP